MGEQTVKEDYLFPDGVAMAVSTDDGLSYEDIGTLAAGVVVTHNYDKIEVESGNKGKPISRAKNETIALAPSALWTWDLNAIQKLSSGMFTFTQVPGTPVAGATQTASSGTWSYNDFIRIENQNYDASAITVNSVTGGTDGPLVSGTDYFEGTNEKGEYGIFIIDSATVTTETQDMVINYDYTPSTGQRITSGTSSLPLERFIVRLRHYTDDALTTYDIECFVYGVDTDSGLSFNFKGANEDGLSEVTVALTGNVDTARPDGAGLIDLFIANTAVV
jgi:hypothetical protein